MRTKLDLRVVQRHRLLRIRPPDHPRQPVAMRRSRRRGSRMWYAVEARPIDGTCSVTSALMGIERRSRSDALSGGPAPVPERVEDAARMREDVREEYVPLLCAFLLGGAGDGDGAESRARLVLR
jgi:hypothetical protein